jgi:hypothetical protein
MNILDFYRDLSLILEQYREEKIGHSTAESRLKQLLSEAKKDGLEVNVSTDILDLDNLVKYDDERSYESTSYEDESSYDEDNEF